MTHSVWQRLARRVLSPNLGFFTLVTTAGSAQELYTNSPIIIKEILAALKQTNLNLSDCRGAAFNSTDKLEETT